MDESITLETRKSEQCRKNAQAKSQRKRQDVLEAIALLQQQGAPISRKTVVQIARVSYPFLAKHADLQQAIDEASDVDRNARLEELKSHTRSQDTAISALKRRVDNLKLKLQDKEGEIRKKQREIDLLYGKLASQGELTNADLREKLTEALKRLQDYESSAKK